MDMIQKKGTLAILLGVFIVSAAFAGVYEKKPQDSDSSAVVRVWIGPDGNPLPFQTNQEIEEFLLTAAVVSMKNIPVGVTQPKKVLLEKDGVKMHAVFRNVNIYKSRWTDVNCTRINFRDYCLYECAAYELSKMLGLYNVPPTVLRRINGKKGTLQIWIENAMMELDRQKKNVQAPDARSWRMQNHMMRIFDNLIFNDDRNQGNMLIDEHWNLWLIDHTRSFRSLSRLPDPKAIRCCEKQLWNMLKNLDESTVKERLGEFLRPPELKALLKRRVKLVEYIEEMIEKRGEKIVVLRH